MKKISKDRLVEFIKMIKEEYPSLAIDESVTYGQLVYKCSGTKFYDIININEFVSISILLSDTVNFAI